MKDLLPIGSVVTLKEGNEIMSEKNDVIRKI